MLTTLFRGAEHEQAKDELESIEAVTAKIEPIFEEGLEQTDNSSYNEILEDVDGSIAEYKRAKEEMARLGFTDYDEYLDYLEYMERRAARKKDMEM